MFKSFFPRNIFFKDTENSSHTNMLNDSSYHLSIIRGTKHMNLRKGSLFSSILNESEMWLKKLIWAQNLIKFGKNIFLILLFMD